MRTDLYRRTVMSRARSCAILATLSYKHPVMLYIATDLGAQQLKPATTIGLHSLMMAGARSQVTVRVLSGRYKT